MSVSVWEAIFMLVVLKIPAIYLATVVWWAVRAEPEGAAGGDDVAVGVPLAPCGWSDWQRHRASRVGRAPTRPRGPRAAPRVVRAS